MRFQPRIVHRATTNERQPPASGRHRSEFRFLGKELLLGGVVAEETAKDARTCHVQIYHDATHASTIQLPLR